MHYALVHLYRIASIWCHWMTFALHIKGILITTATVADASGGRIALSTSFFMHKYTFTQLNIRDIDDRWWSLSLQYLKHSIRGFLPLRQQSLSVCSGSLVCLVPFCQEPSYYFYCIVSLIFLSLASRLLARGFLILHHPFFFPQKFFSSIDTQL